MCFLRSLKAFIVQPSSLKIKYRSIWHNHVENVSCTYWELKKLWKCKSNALINFYEIKTINSLSRYPLMHFNCVFNDAPSTCPHQNCSVESIVFIIGKSNNVMRRKRKNKHKLVFHKSVSSWNNSIRKFFLITSQGLILSSRQHSARMTVFLLFYHTLDPTLRALFASHDFSKFWFKYSFGFITFNEMKFAWILSSLN